MNTNKRKEIFFISATIIFTTFVLILIGIMISFGIMLLHPPFIIFELILNQLCGIIVGILTLMLFLALVIDLIVLHLIQYKIVNRKKYKEYKKQKSE